MNVKETKVITFGELIIYIFGIIFIFILFFPKNMLEKYVLSENKNYVLAVEYLKGLIRANPYNADFVLYLIKYELKLGHLKKASELIEKYSSNPSYLNNFTFLKSAYLLNKTLYFKTKKKIYLKLAEKYLTYILFKFKKYKFVFKEAKSLDLLDLEYLALMYFYKENEVYEKEFIRLAEILRKYDELLKLYDYEYKKTGNIAFLVRKANVLLYIKRDYKAYKIYIFLFKRKNEFKYFKKAIDILLFYKKVNKAYLLLKKYEKYFLSKKDSKALEFILKTYLSLNRLKDAKELSKKILKGNI